MRKLLYALAFIFIMSSKLYALDFDDDEIPQNIVKKTRVPVKVFKPIEKISDITVEVPGRIDLSNVCAITSKTEGYITTYVGRGDSVKKGKVIADIQNEILKTKALFLKNKISLIKGELLNFNKKLKNYQELFQLGLVSKNDLVNLKNTILNKKLELENLQHQLRILQFQENYSKIISPCNGYVLEIVPNKGYVKIGTQIAKVYNPQKAYLSLYLPIEYLSEIKTNKKLKIKILKKWYIGKIKEVIPITNGNLVEVKVSDINSLFLPLNYKFTAKISIKKLKGLVIPKEAIVIKDNKPILFIVKNNKAIMKQINVLKDLGNEVLVTGDLSPKDLVVISNSYRLQNGTEVTIR
nr:efflux RND transporter periplasmic adaptor subunit [Desulfurobacterium thermolithotrophum]